MRILIVDDQQLFIDGIRHIITALYSDVDILQATSTDQAIAHLDNSPALDLLLLGLHMPGAGSWSVIRHRRIRNDRTPVVILSGEEDLTTIQSVIDEGAMGFIPKSSSAEELLIALRAIMKGEVYLPASIRNQLRRLSKDQRAQPDSAADADDPGITRRQHEVLELLASGHSNKQISNALCLTENTVKAHVSALLRALGAANRTECVSIARNKGLIL